MSKKLSICLVAVLCVALLAAGCQQPAAPAQSSAASQSAPAVASSAAPAVSSSAPASAPAASSAPADKKIKVGYIVKVINPYFTVMIQGAKDEAAKLGVDLQVAAAKEQTAVEEQVAIVQDMISKKVDAICIAPIDSEALIPVLQDAQKAGIAVINVDNRLNAATIEKLGMNPITYVGVSDVDSAYMAAKCIVDALKGQGEVAILEGIRGADNARMRKEGAEKAFGEAPGIKIVASQTANWNPEEANTVFTNILQANPNITGVFCSNDAMSFGVIQAIEAAGKTGKIVVTSIDAEDAAIDNVKTGKALATVYQNQDAQAAKAVDLAVEVVKGNKIDKEYIVKTILKTKADLQ